jgi:predicted transcriptional regulator of viral defense system
MRCDSLKAGVDYHVVARLTERGLLERVRRGSYRRADMSAAEVGVVDVAAAASNGVVCLPSALAHYDLKTMTLWEVYLAIPRKAWQPRATGDDFDPIWHAGG